MAEYSYLSLIGGFLGIFLRTVGPYLVRLSKGSVEFDVKFLRAAALAAALTILSAGGVGDNLPPGMGVFWTLWFSMSAGFTTQSVLRELEKLLVEQE